MPETRTHDDLFRQEWVRWQPRIYAFIRSLVFQRSDADDLLQDTAAVLWSKIAEFEPGTRFDQWAFSVARNKVMNFQKSKGRERARFSDELQETLADESAALFTGSGNMLDSLEACLEKLPEHQRDLVRRRYQPNANNRTLARDLDRSESSVSRALSVIYGLLLGCMESRAPTVEGVSR